MRPPPIAITAPPRAPDDPAARLPRVAEARERDRLARERLSRDAEFVFSGGKGRR